MFILTETTGKIKGYIFKLNNKYIYIYRGLDVTLPVGHPHAKGTKISACNNICNIEYKSQEHF